MACFRSAALCPSAEGTIPWMALSLGIACNYSEGRWVSTLTASGRTLAPTAVLSVGASDPFRRHPLRSSISISSFVCLLITSTSISLSVLPSCNGFAPRYDCSSRPQMQTKSCSSFLAHSRAQTFQLWSSRCCPSFVSQPRVERTSSSTCSCCNCSTSTSRQVSSNCLLVHPLQS